MIESNNEDWKETAIKSMQIYFNKEKYLELEDAKKYASQELRDAYFNGWIDAISFNGKIH